MGGGLRGYFTRALKDLFAVEPPYVTEIVPLSSLPFAVPGRFHLHCSRPRVKPARAALTALPPTIRVQVQGSVRPVR